VRQVSFTLLITRRCDRNPAQYERNRRFGHLVHVLDRPISGAKLPSVELYLNASKIESRLVSTTILIVPAAHRGRVSVDLSAVLLPSGSEISVVNTSISPLLGEKAYGDN
jgi:hypothetical protein